MDTTNIEAGAQRPLTHDEHAELAWLRVENVLLRTERDLLLKTATGFAEDANIIPFHRHE